MSYVLHNGSLGELGGKAHALASLAAAELPIPEWFAVTPAAFCRSLSTAQSHALLSGEPDCIRAALVTLLPADEVNVEILSALSALSADSTRFAVRSSAVDEDGAENSFAGQLASYLFVDRDSAICRIADVWRSGFTPQLLEYRKQRGLTATSADAPAVLVQRMVDAEASGVAFSADPVSGRRAIAVVSAVFGLGTALVGGEAEADVYEVDREGTIRRRTIARKNISHRFDPQAEEGVSSSPVPEEKTAQAVLSDAQIMAVAALARRAEAAFGQPQDIEWAFQNGELFLLQSRPITTLRRLADPDGALNIWDNSNITESYSGVTTPLTFSFARYIYEGVYRQFCRILSIPAGKIVENDQTFRHMLGLVRGRVYYNLLNWYRVLALLPGFTVNRRFMEQMMGVRESPPPEVLEGLNAATTAERLSDALSVASMLFGLVRNYLTLDSQTERFYQRLRGALAPPTPPLAQMRLDELTAHYHWLERRLLTHWDAPLVNDFFAMIFHGTFRKLTMKWLDDRDGMLANDAIRGEGGMISAEPALRVREMANLASTDPEFIRLLCEAPADEALTAARAHRDFHEKYSAYLEKFGDRCLEELKLESETLHENPMVLLRNVGELARVAEESPSRSSQSSAQDAEQKIRSALKYSPLKRAVIGWVLRNARARVRQRENLRFERTRLFGRIRRIFLEAGRRLHAIGELDDPRDVFYLEVKEVLAYVEGCAVTADLRELVAVRRQEFQRYRESAPPPERFETRGAVNHAQSYEQKPSAVESDAQGEERRGIGCCPGTVRGTACVVRDPRNARVPQGSILVADHTDPGWIMLFPLAKGLLVERGSLLSHSAIVARELGIPAVVSIRGLTEWIQTGDVVELDGAQGVVRRIASGDRHAQ